MKPALNDWVWAAPTEVSIQLHQFAGFTPMADNCSGVPKGMPRKWPPAWVRDRSTLVEAKRLSEDPACSKRVKKTTDPSTRMAASPILWRSTVVLQTRMMIQARAAMDSMMAAISAPPTSLLF